MATILDDGLDPQTKLIQDALWQQLVKISITSYGLLQMLEGCISDENTVTYSLHGDKMYPKDEFRLLFSSSPRNRYPLTDLMIQYPEQHQKGFSVPDFLEYVKLAEERGVTVLVWTGGGFYARGFIFLNCNSNATLEKLLANLSKFEGDIAMLRQMGGLCKTPPTS